MAAIVAVRWYAGGMKDLIIDIWVKDTDPGQRVEMKVAFFNVAKKSSPFKPANFQLDANALQLFF